MELALKLESIQKKTDHHYKAKFASQFTDNYFNGTYKVVVPTYHCDYVRIFTESEYYTLEHEKNKYILTFNEAKSHFVLHFYFNESVSHKEFKKYVNEFIAKNAAPVDGKNVVVNTNLYLDDEEVSLDDLGIFNVMAKNQDNQLFTITNLNIKDHIITVPEDSSEGHILEQQVGCVNHRMLYIKRSDFEINCTTSIDLHFVTSVISRITIPDYVSADETLDEHYKHTYEDIITKYLYIDVVDHHNHAVYLHNAKVQAHSSYIVNIPKSGVRVNIHPKLRFHHHEIFPFEVYMSSAHEITLYKDANTITPPIMYQLQTKDKVKLRVPLFNLNGVYAGDSFAAIFTLQGIGAPFTVAANNVIIPDLYEVISVDLAAQKKHVKPVILKWTTHEVELQKQEDGTYEPDKSFFVFPVGCKLELELWGDIDLEPIKDIETMSLSLIGVNVPTTESVYYDKGLRLLGKYEEGLSIYDAAVDHQLNLVLLDNVVIGKEGCIIIGDEKYKSILEGDAERYADFIGSKMMLNANNTLEAVTIKPLCVSQFVFDKEFLKAIACGNAKKIHKAIKEYAVSTNKDYKDFLSSLCSLLVIANFINLDLTNLGCQGPRVLMLFAKAIHDINMQVVGRDEKALLSVSVDVKFSDESLLPYDSKPGLLAEFTDTWTDGEFCDVMTEENGYCHPFLVIANVKDIDECVDLSAASQAILSSCTYSISILGEVLGNTNVGTVNSRLLAGGKALVSTLSDCPLKSSAMYDLVKLMHEQGRGGIILDSIEDLPLNARGYVESNNNNCEIIKHTRFQSADFTWLSFWNHSHCETLHCHDADCKDSRHHHSRHHSRHHHSRHHHSRHHHSRHHHNNSYCCTKKRELKCSLFDED